VEKLTSNLQHLGVLEAGGNENLEPVEEDTPGVKHETLPREGAPSSDPLLWEPEPSPPWRKMLLPTATPLSASKRRKEVSVTHPTALPFPQVRERLALELLASFDADIFGGILAGLTEVVWSRTLNKTAGRTHMIQVRMNTGTLAAAQQDPAAPPLHRARIELSTKVLDCEARLRNTLAHEMCHATVWILHRTSAQPHGPLFQAWGRRCEAVHADLVVKTCHSYEISYRYNYRCTNPFCNRV
jgi:hypothetical protein